jgi:pyruvate ferredoxin oxidoreductase delta subunit
MSTAQKPGWRQLTRGAVIVTPGSAREFHTGDWRTQRPILQESKCTNCLFCWIWCPEPAIVREAKKISFDYNYCKGCGICAVECPVKAITMVEEH